MGVRSVVALLSLSAGLSAPALADIIPYPDRTVPAPAVTLTATATGNVQGYFVGQSAGDLDTVALLNLTTGVLSPYLFPNQTTAPGTTASFGLVTQGDQLVFVMYDARTGSTLRSDADNEDGFAHAYITPFSGGTLEGNDFPAGVYVGFEDLLASQGSDFDYNDNSFTFTNIGVTTQPTQPSAVPEPGTLALMGTGALGAVGLLRRRFPRA